MPNIKQAIKRVRVTEKKTAVNKNKKSELRTAIKKAQVAVAEGSESAEAVVRLAQKRIAQAAGKGRMKKKTASRRISRLQKAFNKLAE